jgi:hypothetical protein
VKRKVAIVVLIAVAGYAAYRAAKAYRLRPRTELAADPIGFNPADATYGRRPNDWTGFLGSEATLVASAYSGTSGG